MDIAKQDYYLYRDFRILVQFVMENRNFPHAPKVQEKKCIPAIFPI